MDESRRKTFTSSSADPGGRVWWTSLEAEGVSLERGRGKKDAGLQSMARRPCVAGGVTLPPLVGLRTVAEVTHELHPRDAGRLCCWAARSPGTLLEQNILQNCGNLFPVPKISIFFFAGFYDVGDRLCHVRVLGLGGGGARAREGRSEAKMDLNHHLYDEAGTPDAGKPKKQEEEER